MAAPPPSPGDGSQKDVFMKILVVGDVNTGKTSICKKIVFDAFSTNYKATIGVDFYSKKLRWDANTTVRLQLWDIAGNERFGTMTKVYYREAVGAIVVYDVTKVQGCDLSIPSTHAAPFEQLPARTDQAACGSAVLARLCLRGCALHAIRSQSHSRRSRSGSRISIRTSPPSAVPPDRSSCPPCSSRTKPTC